MALSLTLKLQLYRHAVQLLAFIFMNGKILGLASTVLIVPYLHATQAPLSTVTGAYEAFEWTVSHGAFPLLTLGVIFGTAITVGKLFCGWACPLGMVQDFLSYLPFTQRTLSAVNVQSLKDMKWAFLLFSICVAFFSSFRRDASDAPMGMFTDSPFSVLSPSGTLFSYIPWMMIWRADALAHAGYLGWVKFALMFAFLVPALYIPRFFCRYACPLGLLVEQFSQFKILRIHRSIKYSHSRTNDVLNDICPMGVTLEENSEFIDHQACIHCGKCVTELPLELEQRLF